MSKLVRCWQRDDDLLRELARSPLLTRQAARLAGFTSPKKASERLGQYYRAGFTKRLPFYHPGAQARPEFANLVGRLPRQRLLRHIIGVAEVRVLSAEAVPHLAPTTIDFYYGHEIRTTCGLMPDGLIVLRRDDRTAIVFGEVDTGTEIVTSGTYYSLAGKLRGYAAYFDSGAYVEDFAWAGRLRGFRVALIVPPGRVRHAQRLIEQEHYDFVLIASPDDLAPGLHRPVWLAHDGNMVDILGRRGGM